MKLTEKQIEVLSRGAAVAQARLQGAQQLVQHLSTAGHLSRVQLDAATALYAPLREAADQAWASYMAALDEHYPHELLVSSVTKEEAARYAVVATAEFIPAGPLASDSYHESRAALV